MEEKNLPQEEKLFCGFVRIQGRMCPWPLPVEQVLEVQKAIDEDEAEMERKKNLSPKK